MSEQEKGRPSFWGPLQASWRQGLKELAQYLPAFPDNPRPIEEPGTMGNPTPPMVTDQLRGELNQDHGKANEYDRLLERYASRGEGNEQRDQDYER